MNWWGPLKTMGRSVMGPTAELEDPKRSVNYGERYQARLPPEAEGKLFIMKSGQRLGIVTEC